MVPLRDAIRSPTTPATTPTAKDTPMAKLPTLTVWRTTDGDEIIINAADFNAALYSRAPLTPEPAKRPLGRRRRASTRATAK